MREIHIPALEPKHQYKSSPRNSDVLESSLMGWSFPERSREGSTGESRSWWLRLSKRLLSALCWPNSASEFLSGWDSEAVEQL